MSHSGKVSFCSSFSPHSSKCRRAWSCEGKDCDGHCCLLSGHEEEYTCRGCMGAAAALAQTSPERERAAATLESPRPQRRLARSTS
eukprot:7037833-Pyramimonas_sp.AAC.1